MNTQASRQSTALGLKTCVKKMSPPSTYDWLAKHYRCWRASRTESRLQRAYAHSGRVALKLIAAQGNLVPQGPFAGLALLPYGVGSALAPKLVGSYEAELHPVFERIFRQKYRRVVDIGCAEGYYAVGLALRLPEAEVWAFDLNPDALKATAHLALLNRVHRRLRLEIECDHKRLNELCAPGTLVVCDIEGAEQELFDPALAPNLRLADLLVEVHPSGTGADRLDVMCRRFESTHASKVISSHERLPAEYPELLRHLAPKDAAIALREFRPPMHWVFWENRGQS